jgi:CMP/dCMP kinase
VLDDLRRRDARDAGRAAAPMAMAADAILLDTSELAIAAAIEAAAAVVRPVHAAALARGA